MSTVPAQETLDGVYDHDIFRNDDSNWTVGVMQSPSRRRPVTIVGCFIAQAGESIELTGHWVMDPKFGEQFKVNSCHAKLPSTIEGLRKYLSSGLIKGIGPTYAERLLERFGLEVPRVIEEFPHRLREIEGIGRERQKRIVAAWSAQKEIKNLMIFLQGHGVSAGLGLKIYKAYGNDAIEKIEQNPYRLASEISGIGFKTADSIAHRIGIARDAPERIDSAIEYVLKEGADSAGHTGMPRHELESSVATMLEIPLEIVVPRSQALAGFAGRIVLKVIQGREIAFFHRYYEAEVRIAAKLLKLREAQPIRERPVKWDKFFEWFQSEKQITFSSEQEEAIRLGYEANVAVVTGGPGTGKSTLVDAITVLCERVGLKVMLSAPTGRAAKRLGEVTGRESKTIHRLLEIDPKARTFKRNEQSPLETEVLIVDEVSMVDVPLFDKLVAALRPGCRLILVGDQDQLPSVGPGNVLRDLIASGDLPVVRLKKIFRQGEGSRIVDVAHGVKEGELEAFFAEVGKSDFYFIEKEDPQKCAEMVVHLVCEKIPKSFSVSHKEIQVLVPMNRGIVGTQGLNQLLQQRINPAIRYIEKGGRRFSEGDRVIQTRNNYDLEIFNGDIGFISAVLAEEKELKCRFDEREVVLDSSDMDDLELAYAITIHKSQGSEFPVIVMPILTQHAILLQRNLLYTGLTRGKKLVVVVGSRKAIGLAAHRADGVSRCTFLKESLAAAFSVQRVRSVAPLAGEPPAREAHDASPLRDSGASEIHPG